MSCLRRFFDHQVPAVAVEPDGRQHFPQQPPGLVVPGSFNPLHAGHIGLAAAAATLLGLNPVFELSVSNPDKPELAPAEVLRRLRPFAWRFPVLVTRAPTFAGKSALFPGAVFAVGADTAERIVAPRYYPGGAAGLAAALEDLRRHRCRFLVAGRRYPDGVFRRLCELHLPAGADDQFAEIPPAVFRLDLSSTEIRGRAPS